MSSNLDPNFILHAFVNQAETGVISSQQSTVHFKGHLYIKLSSETGEISTTSKKGQRANFVQIQRLYRQAMQDERLNNEDAAKLEKAMSVIIFQEHSTVSEPLLA